MTFYNPTVSVVIIANLLITLVNVIVCTSEIYCSHFEVIRSKGHSLCRPMGLTTKFRRAQLPRRRIAFTPYDYNITFRKRDIAKKKQVK